VPIPAPNVVPVPAPTTAPSTTPDIKKKKKKNANAASLAIILIAVGAGLFVVIGGAVAYMQYKRSQENKVEMNFGLTEDINTFNVDNEQRESGVFSSQLNKLRQASFSEPVSESAVGKHMDL
jgi:uncharacterized protein HemX